MGINLKISRVKINLFFILFLFLFFIFGYIQYAVISFSIVFLHELSHSLIAYILGYKIKEIEIFPLGGVVRLSDFIGINPKHEIMIALAGPISNLIMSIIGYLVIKNYNINNSLLTYFIYANIIITITNLLPVLPLDGGRVARAYLTYLIGIKKSTKVITVISKFFSVIIFFLGIVLLTYNKFNILISFVAIFLYISIQKENEMAVFIFMKEIIDKKQALINNGVLKTKQLVATKETSLKKVINKFKPQRYHIITVMDEKCNVVGVLTESDIIEGIIKYGFHAKLERLLINTKRW